MHVLYIYIFIYLCMHVCVYLQAGKKRRINTNKENDDLSLLQQSVLSEIRATDESINATKSDSVITFCNYLTTQLCTLSQDDFTKCQRKISFVFELQDK